MEEFSTCRTRNGAASDCKCFQAACTLLVWSNTCGFPLGFAVLWIGVATTKGPDSSVQVLDVGDGGMSILFEDG